MELVMAEFLRWRFWAKVFRLGNDFGSPLDVSRCFLVDVMFFLLFFLSSLSCHSFYFASTYPQI